MMPNAGRMMMYTSGWPKNQKMCWYITGSPPPAAEKKLVPKNWSVSSIVTAPARTGIAMIIRYAVISHVQQNIGIFIRPIPGARMFMIVTMMLIDAMIDDRPSRWTAKIENGSDAPCCRESGGYIVQPDAGAPPGIRNVMRSSVVANGSSQNDQLFSLGSAISGAPIISGTIQFAKPANAGMIAPKIMISAWTVVIWLKKCGSTNCSPGWNSSVRITSAIAPPTNSISSENVRYSVPISLWLVVVIQRKIHGRTPFG